MTATIAAPTYESYEDARWAAEVEVIRFELQVLPALRSVDAAWVAYVKEEFLSPERRAAGLRFLAAQAAYDSVYELYCAALKEFRTVYPER